MKGLKLISNKKIIYTDKIDFPRKLFNKDWVRVKVKAAGLCGSDIQKIFSKKSLDKYGVNTDILGHEISGIVDLVPSLNKGINKGDKVTIKPLIHCEKCDYCKEGRYQFCFNLKTIGKSYPGGFQEYILVPIKNIFKISNKISFEEGCLIDVVAVAIHSFHMACEPTNKNIAIFGDGPLSIVLAQIIKFKKNNVFVFGKNSFRLNIVKEFVDYVFNTNEVNFNEFANFFDLAFEVRGGNTSETLINSINIVKPLGKILVLGVFDIDFYGKFIFRNLFYKEASLIGINSYGYYKNEDEFKMAINLVEKGVVNLKKIITHKFRFEEVGRVIQLLKKKEKEFVKIIFVS